MTSFSFRKTLALGGAALALGAAFAGFNFPAQADNMLRCDQGALMGQFAFKSSVKNRYVKPDGLSRQLKVSQVQAPVSGAAGSFDVFRLGKEDGGHVYAFRSTKNPNLWVSLDRRGSRLALTARECTSRTKRSLFVAAPSGNGLSLRSLKTNRWVGVKPDAQLVAKYRTPNARTQLQQVDLGPVRGLRQLNGN